MLRCVTLRRVASHTVVCLTRLFLASPKKVSEDELQWHLDSFGDVCVCRCVAGVCEWPRVFRAVFSGVILRGRRGP